MSMSFRVFYMWWIGFNACLCGAECDFFFQAVKRNRRLESSGAQTVCGGVLAACGSRCAERNCTFAGCLLYISLHCFLTWAAMAFAAPVFLRRLVHVVLMYLLVSRVFGAGKAESAALICTVCSLSICVEGMSAVCMRWASSNISGLGAGLVVQTLLSAVLLYLFWRGLRLAGRRYRALQAITPAQATAFLLPCGFIFWAVRFGFGLNRTDLAGSSYPLTGISMPEAMGIVVCAAAALWALLTSFEGAVALREQKQRAETLCCRLEIQKQYAAEVQQKEEHLQSIQHDMDNHLIVLLGLLSQGRCQEAHEYTQTLKDAASGMRRQEAARHRAAMGPPTYVRPSKAAQGLAPVQHPALAVLLCAKIEWAQKQQIGISCQVSLPWEISIDEMDICTVVANGLDNAIKECGRVKQRGRRTPHIDMFMGLRGHFVLVEITNTAVSSKALVPGTGLGNIRRTAEKYQGTMETAQENGCFRLSVLLCTDC